MNWIMSRVKEMSSWSGAGLIGLGALVKRTKSFFIFNNSLSTMIACSFSVIPL